jgi:hypothetical protein
MFYGRPIFGGSKSGLTSAPRFPHLWHTKRSSISEAMIVGAIDQDATHAHLIAHFAERDLLRSHADIKAAA